MYKVIIIFSSLPQAVMLVIKCFFFFYEILVQPGWKIPQFSCSLSDLLNEVIFNWLICHLFIQSSSAADPHPAPDS